MYRDVPREAIGPGLLTVAAQYRSRLVGIDPHVLRARRHPHVWSPLEYGAHVRDVLGVQRERVALVLRLSEPRFGSMRPDEQVVERADADDDPAAVVAAIEQGAALLAGLFDGLGDREWSRTAIHGWPEPVRRDLVWIGRHTLHELSHHLLDITRGLVATPARASG